MQRKRQLRKQLLHSRGRRNVPGNCSLYRQSHLRSWWLASAPHPHAICRQRPRCRPVTSVTRLTSAWRLHEGSRRLPPVSRNLTVSVQAARAAGRSHRFSYASQPLLLQAAPTLPVRNRSEPYCLGPYPLRIRTRVAASSTLVTTRSGHRVWGASATCFPRSRVPTPASRTVAPPRRAHAAWHNKAPHRRARKYPCRETRARAGPSCNQAGRQRRAHVIVLDMNVHIATE